MTLRSSTTRVLVVEDHDDTRAAVALALSRAGFTVTETADGQAAFERLLIDEELPLMIVLDLELPVMSGWEFLELVRSYSRLAAIPVIVVSGRESPAAVLDATSPTTYMKKPLDPDALVAFANSLTNPDSSGRWRIAP